MPLTSDLNDPIMAALHNSEWLIVICSPRLRESLWCKKEIETFIELHGREHVLVVLIEGEPTNDCIAYLDSSGRISIYNLNTRKVENVLSEEQAYGLLCQYTYFDPK